LDWIQCKHVRRCARRVEALAYGVPREHHPRKALLDERL
jgi:hypothetical protein